ncbi:unnamed protein product [Phytophthora fragariaefolia]|uniref:Unnamed protein product n=1 Tax=Phytophthora fragariaefolia TaxID=1490495 RepID=A0A9W6UB18_9STRA|nr:unnamed protein product [Phytophthora fragariaefolia]
MTTSTSWCLLITSLDGWKHSPEPLSSSISTGTEASVPGVIPLGPPGVLGSDAVDAVNDTGDAGVLGIGENGGSDPLGIDANDNTSLSAKTAMPETGADEVETEAVGSDEGTLSVKTHCRWPPQRPLA